MDVSQYLEIFIDETKEHLQSLNTQILDLEQDPENETTINEIFRAAHSLKGMAGTMGFKRMQNLTHDMENVFSEVRAGNLKVNGTMIDILFQCLDALDEYLTTIQSTADEGVNENENLIKALNDQLNGGGSASEAAPAKQEAATETAAEAPADNSSSDSEKAQWKSITLDESQKTVISSAVEQGMNVYGITVFVEASCLLKAARSFLVFKAVEDSGEIIVSNPSTQDIEDEKFELSFSLIVISGDKLDKIIAAIKNVSEIEDAYGEPLDKSAYAQVEEAPAQPEVVENKQTVENAPAAPVAASPEPKKEAAKKPAAAKPVVNRTVRVDIEKLDVLMNLVSELIIAKNSLVSASGTNNLDRGFNEQIEYLESVTTNLHESVMKVRMVPIESTVNKFPRMIRDLSKNLGKKMELYMTGEETELDRTVVDEIGDPLMHLLRNSADHGLESAEVRRERGKSEVGSIFLNAYQEGNNVIIEVGDDGNGIDVEKVKAKAIEKGIINEEQAAAMNDKEAIDLLFSAGFSTAKVISDVSGRGVGLDVVKSKIEALSGEVDVKTKLGEGSTFTIRLPLTLAIIQALMVVVGEEMYAISLGSIQTIEDVPVSDIKFVQAKEVINLRGTVIPLIRLHEVLDIPESEEKTDSLMVVIVKKGDKLAGLVVDKLIGQQEIVIKSLGKLINKFKIISGATILGDGEVALILDTNAML
ncbi:MAG: chemotaxis protein CheA [Lachnospiraceae bacterium]|nr:chemotaxis protein CheA [Candidatus Merdinaster equi]